MFTCKLLLNWAHFVLAQDMIVCILYKTVQFSACVLSLCVYMYIHVYIIHYTCTCTCTSLLLAYYMSTGISGL